MYSNTVKNTVKYLNNCTKLATFLKYFFYLLTNSKWLKFNTENNVISSNIFKYLVYLSKMFTI